MSKVLLANSVSPLPMFALRRQRVLECRLHNVRSKHSQPTCVCTVWTHVGCGPRVGVGGLITLGSDRPCTVLHSSSTAKTAACLVASSPLTADTEGTDTAPAEGSLLRPDLAQEGNCGGLGLLTSAYLMFSPAVVPLCRLLKLCISSKSYAASTCVQPDKRQKKEDGTQAVRKKRKKELQGRVLAG